MSVNPNEMRGDGLFQFLSEAPDDNALLWRAFWDEQKAPSTGDRSWPVIVENYSRMVLKKHGGNVNLLVHGRYGTGKSSFLRMLQKRFALEEDGKGRVIPLWLHMPILTANQCTSPMAAVMSAMVEKMCMDRGGGGESCMSNDTRHSLEKGMEDLWQLESSEANNCLERTGSTLEAPRQNRLSGSTGEAFRTTRASMLEQQIDAALGWGASSDKRRSMLVFLDDLDRCRDGVSMHVIRLLLRFGNCQGVHFAIASDWEVLQRGADQWMERYGAVHDSEKLVTSESALEKYIHVRVELPKLTDNCVMPVSKIDSLLSEQSSWQDIKGYGADANNGFIDSSDKLDSTPNLLNVFVCRLFSEINIKDLGSVSIVDPKDRGTSDMSSLGKETAGQVGEPSVRNSMPESLPGQAVETDEDKKKSPNKQDGIIEKKTGENLTESEHNVMAGHSAFAMALKDLFIYQEPMYKLRKKYEPYARYLTLRQFKFLLRDRLMQSVRSDSSQDAHVGHLAVLLMEQLFHGFWRIRRDDEPLYKQLHLSARGFLKYSEIINNENGEVDDGTLSLFYQDVGRILAGARHPFELSQYQPRRRHERALLMYLLASETWNKLSSPSTGSKSDFRSADLSEQTRTPVASSAAKQSPQNQESAEQESTRFSGGVDTDFATWAKATLGRPLSGANVAEQLSNFQDDVLAIKGSGSEAAPIVVEYVERFLGRHKDSLTRQSAVSLSNLAVILSDQVGAEAPCNRLFDLAVKLDSDNRRLALIQAEFLLDVLDEPTRLASLIADKNPYADEGDVRERVRQLIDQPINDPEDQIRAGLYQLVLNANVEQADSDKAQELMKFLSDQAAPLLKAGKSSPGALAARVVDALNKIIGSREENKIRIKGQTLAVATGILQRCGAATWGMMRVTANSYVGESRAQSMQEKLGLRMNRALLSDAGMLATLGEEERFSAIWNQSALALSRLADRNAESQMMLACLAGLLYSQKDRHWSRIKRVWQRFHPNEQAQVSPEALMRALKPEHRASFDRLALNLGDAAAAKAVADIVFDLPEMESISSWEELAQAEDWAVNELKAINDAIAQGVANGCPESHTNELQS